MPNSIVRNPKICCIYNKTLNCNCIEEGECPSDCYPLFVYPKFMAPTLTSSNSFLLNTTPRSRLIIKNPRFSVFAKKARPFPPFQVGKSKDENSSDESSNGDSGNSNPFCFNFGKVRDVTSLIPVVSSPGTGLSFGTGQAGVRILWQRPRRRENDTPKDSRGRDEVAAAAEKMLLEGEKEKALLP